MRFMIIVVSLAAVVGVVYWVASSAVPMPPTLPEIGPGARSTVALDLSHRD